MVERYYNLQQRFLKGERTIGKQAKCIHEQEVICKQLRCFIHDCLDQIFQIVHQRDEHIRKTCELEGQLIKVEEQNDPFVLYQFYVNLVKPVDYMQDLSHMQAENERLKEEINAVNMKAEAIEAACKQYLEEEKEIKEKLRNLDQDLLLEKLNRTSERNKLQAKIADLEWNYERDVNQVNQELMRLLDFSDLERTVRENVEKKLKQRIEDLKSEMKGL